ncbi:MAG: hypothetical protein IT160_20010 [Bryobacterales bacterium]|nr:hypothetical protein [Bryobacterales bacterium]
MYKNRISGMRCKTSEQVIAKSTSIKGTGYKSSGYGLKTVELTSGDLPFVPDSGLRVERSILTGRRKPAAGGRLPMFISTLK